MIRQKNNPTLLTAAMKLFSRYVKKPVQCTVFFATRISRLRNDDFYFW